MRLADARGERPLNDNPQPEPERAHGWQMRALGLCLLMQRRASESLSDAFYDIV